MFTSSGKNSSQAQVSPDLAGENLVLLKYLPVYRLVCSNRNCANIFSFILMVVI